MKKTLVVVLLLFVFVLSACAGNPGVTASQATAQPVEQVGSVPAEPASAAEPTAAEQAALAETSATTAAQAVTLNTDYENALSIEMQLLFGLFKLSDTDLVVTAEQAQALLPFWNELKTLNQSMAPAQPVAGQTDSSGTALAQSVDPETQAKLDALAAQILAILTPEQIQAIAGMKITQETAMTIMQEQSISMGGPQGVTAGTPPTGNGGQPPQGNPPGGGAGAGSGNQPPQGTPPAGGPGSGQASGMLAGSMLPPGLIDALISQLEKIGGVSTEATTSSGSSANSVSASSNTTAAVYSQSGGSQSLDGQSFTASETDQSAVYVSDGGALTLTNATITTSGNTSSNDNSSFYGLNAAVLAASGSSINLSDSSISTSGTGANGAFATGSGSTVNLSDVTIQATGDGGHGVMATQGGVMTLNQVNMTTSGKNSGAIATDRGSGTITVTGGVVATSGQDSPGIYSTGAITVSGATISASGAEAAAIEGANSIILTDTDLSSTFDNKWGVMIYQSMSGDAEGAQGIFTMTGGSLTYTAASGPLFYVTNSTGIITLKDVTLTAGAGELILASAGNWGQSGSNGGSVVFTADGQSLSGNLVADNISAIALTLQNGSTLAGAINSGNTAKAINLTLDASSSWNVTADSYLTCLDDAAGISGTSITNIIGNGHTVYYDQGACSALGGQTYTLSGGGLLTPTG